MIIDTHCHYNLEPLASDWQAHWHKAQAAGVAQTIIVGTSLTTSKLACEMAEQDTNLFAAVGMHPNTWEEDQLTSTNAVDPTAYCQQLVPFITANKVVAIGETGLDYFHTDKSLLSFTTIQATQIGALRAHLTLAGEHQLPLILHVRDKEIPEQPTPNNAYWDVVKLCTEYQTNYPQLQLILHCVSGPLAYVQTMLNLGAYVSVAGNGTYPSAEHIRQLVMATPADKLLIETDAPFLPPQGFRGKPCEPWMIANTADFICKLTGTTLEQLKQNTHKLFPRLSQSTIQ